MSVFPAKILVATDGSEDAILAVQAAVDLSNETGTELHVVHVGESLHVYPPPASGPPEHRRRLGRRSTRWPGGCSKRKSNRSERWGAR
jgi:nucleotide-binding universal stress UspA family protein